VKVGEYIPLQNCVPKHRLGGVEIVTLGDPREKVLRRRAKRVGRVTGEIQKLVDAMVETMRGARGVGLAAPQVGVSLRVFVAEVNGKLHTLVDPVVLRSEGQELAIEGCLSMPGIAAEVPRATRIRVKGKNKRGKGVSVLANGLLARVFQHEIDHLDGILMVDRVLDPSSIHEIPAEDTSEVAPSSK